MPDIYDPERGLKIVLTDDDYDDYQKGNLSGDFYARRTDGSIANKVDISRTITIIVMSTKNRQAGLTQVLLQ